MAHIRKQIRDAVLAELAGQPITQGRVFDRPIHSLQENELPALVVISGDERVEWATAGQPRLSARDADVMVECVADGNDYQDTLDTMIVAVEKALHMNATIDAICKDFTLTEIKTTGIGDGDKPVGVASMIFAAEYNAAEIDPETAL